MTCADFCERCGQPLRWAECWNRGARRRHARIRGASISTSASSIESRIDDIIRNTSIPPGYLSRMYLREVLEYLDTPDR
jgi:hypothetical protein